MKRMILIMLTLYTSLSLGAVGDGLMLRSPFCELGELDSVAETSQHIIIVDLDYLKMQDSKITEPYSVIFFNKQDHSTRIYPAYRELYLDGGSRIIKFKVDDQDGLLYLPYKPGVRGLVGFEQKNKSYLEKGIEFGLDPFLYIGSDLTPVLRSSAYARADAGLDILAPIFAGKNPDLIDSRKELDRLNKPRSRIREFCGFLLGKLPL